MKRILSAVFLFAFMLGLSLNANAQQEGKEMSAEMKAWMDYMTPGPAHEWMAKGVGGWKAVMKMWSQPDAEPQVYEGTATNEMMMGGRYFKSTLRSTVMGMPMEGQSISAFDNALKEFINIWIDNFGTGVAVSRGTYDEKTKTLTMKGSMIDPMTGNDVDFKQLMKEVNNDKQSFEMYMMMDGNEFKSMEVEYTRIK